MVFNIQAAERIDMKKVITALIALFLFMPAAYASDVSVIINGKPLNSDNEAVIVEDRVLVPMRAIFESLGAEINWNEDEYTVYASYMNSAMKIPIGSKTLYMGIINSDGMQVFSSERDIDVSATLINDRTYVPVRAVAEAFKSKVSWDESERRVTIEPQNNGDGVFYYASADDFEKLYSVDLNGINRTKLSDKRTKEIYVDGDYVYYVASDGFLYRQTTRNKDDKAAAKPSEERITDYPTQVISIDDGRIFCCNKYEKTVFEYGINNKELGVMENPKRHNNFLYYNKHGENPMFILNLDTYEETSADMGSNIQLSPFNCVFYGNYILVENGAAYHNIYRFDANGGNKTVLNSNNSFICRNQEQDDRILYINGDNGQDIYSVNISGGEKMLAADLPEDCAYADVLAQNGNYFYYKNMYRQEIYRSSLDNSDNTYVGYGDTAAVFENKLFISGEGIYISDLDGTNEQRIYNGRLNGLFAQDGNVFGTDEAFGNILKISYDGKCENVTNDKALVWTKSF